jgi:hypothetical protein
VVEGRRLASPGAGASQAIQEVVEESWLQCSPGPGKMDFADMQSVPCKVIGAIQEVCESATSVSWTGRVVTAHGLLKW